MKTVRKSETGDIPRLMDIYREGREIMLSCGNLHQWKPGYPTEEIIREDIAKEQGYAILEDGEVVGAFAFIYGEDPTYKAIYGGRWIDDTKPYATIHRLASLKSSKGVAEVCFDWCWERIKNVRVDTHEDNAIMRHCIEKAGFKYCGIIHLLNGDPRLAYQKTDRE
ncbi:MAG: GNAT family N-acetyltransferase [Bacteroidia bacterium]|nr:GNAT family N-acetyltransferase [Bacteroidia bacterium]